MVRSPYPPGALHITWLGDGFGLWIADPRARARDVGQVAVGLFGPDVRSGLNDLFVEHTLHSSSDEVPVPTASMVRIDPHSLLAAVVRQRPSPNWSGSICWLHDLTLTAVEVAASGSFLPTVHTAGLRWRAEWTPVPNADIDSAVEALAAGVPPVVVAGSDKPVLNQVARMIDTSVDALCRFALVEADWRPPLPRTRASAVVALRRITQALARPDDAVFLGDSAAHEAAFAEWATQLSDHRSVIAGAPDVRLRGQLDPPVDPTSETAVWTVRFFVADGEETIPFADIWSCLLYTSDAADE